MGGQTIRSALSGEGGPFFPCIVMEKHPMSQQVHQVHYSGADCFAQFVAQAIEGTARIDPAVLSPEEIGRRAVAIADATLREIIVWRKQHAEVLKAAMEKAEKEPQSQPTGNILLPL
jgi:hypothetical protein